MQVVRLGMLALVVLATGTVVRSGPAGADAFMRNHLYVPSSADASARIYVRETLPAGHQAAEMGKAVLMVHGATYPGDSFDLPIAEYNWTEDLVRRGYAAYYLDIRGYGRSTRPATMDLPAADNPPFSRATDAIRDIGDAAALIRERAGVAKVYLIGWSWGTVTTGMFSARNNDLVEKLVLYAPVYALHLPDRIAQFGLADPADPRRFNPAIGAYRTVTEAAARARWEAQIVPDDKDAWREDRVFRTWFSELLRTDPASNDTAPPKLRAPNGVLIDVFEIFSGRPIFEAAEILVPTLVLRGLDDPTATHEDAVGLFDRLGAVDKELVELEDGSHFISLERNPGRVFDAVAAFLEK